MSMRLFLVRHGESAWNRAGKAQGQADPPLTEHGRLQAVAAAEALRGRPVTAVYTSPLMRAHQTAVAIGSPHGLVPLVDPALREIFLGARQGLPLDEIEDVFHVAGGEELREVRARIAPTIDAMLDRHGGETVVIVTHSILGRVALCHLLGAGLQLVSHLKLKLASLSLVRVERGVAVLERLGDINHLSTLSPAQGPADLVQAMGGRS